MDKQIVVYKTADDIRLEVQTDGETVWLTQEQMCRLFGRERSVITKHIANIFKEGELEREVVCAKFAHTTMHGAMKGKLQKKDVVAYNLDVVISVGYRVKSIQGTRFRQCEEVGSDTPLATLHARPGQWPAVWMRGA